MTRAKKDAVPVTTGTTTEEAIADLLRGLVQMFTQMHTLVEKRLDNVEEKVEELGDKIDDVESVVDDGNRLLRDIEDRMRRADIEDRLRRQALQQGGGH